LRECRRPAPHGAGRDDPSFSQDREAVGELLDLVQIVRGQEDGLAKTAQRADRLPGAAPRAGVEAGRRLVEEDQLRVADQRETEIEPPALAAGEPPRTRVALLLEPDQLDHLVDGARMLVVPGELAQLLRDGEVLVHGRGLEHNADPSSPAEAGCLGVRPEHLDLAGIPPTVALEDLDGRRLAGSVRSEQAENLAGADLEVDALDRFEVVVRLRQAANADDRCHGRRI